VQRMTRKLLAAATIAAVLAAGTPASALAQTAPGLGSSQPNTPDVTANPQFHVYRWNMNGVTYVQVNDIVGNPVLAFGAAGNGQVLVLPVGNPASVTVVAPAANASTAGATVYKTATLVVTQTASGFAVSNAGVAPQTQVQAAACQDPGECTGAPAAATH